MTIAAVLIGRNEGERLLNCLASVSGLARIVYVDSGSTDGSVEAAEAVGAEVIVLDMTQPFTAARARNAGLERLRNLGERPDFVQFIDGDCELQSGWIDTAHGFLAEHETAAVACGRRRERFPKATVYNALCDAEWDTPIGRALACGGDALMRMAALDQVGGYNPNLIAGEEPELCVRLRGNGWEVWRLDCEMTLHDAAMTRFGQWWKRTRRAGHAYAEGAAMHGQPPERHFVAQARRALLWGAALPLVILLAALIFGPWALLFLAIYPAQVLRLSRRVGWRNAFFLTLGKFPEALGGLEFHLRRMVRRPAGLIEYK